MEHFPLTRPLKDGPWTVEAAFVPGFCPESETVEKQPDFFFPAMVPIKPNDGSPGLYPAMGNKEALASDPKGPPNSSLMKALDAVITAGRRGLLGPAAMVSPVPALNLDSGKGVVSRENLKPIPLVAGHDQRKKAVSEKRTAVITVVPSAEGESSKTTNCWNVDDASFPRKSGNVYVPLEQKRLPIPCPLNVQNLYWL